MLLDRLGNFSSRAGALSQAAVQIDETVSVRFKAGTHRVPGVNSQLPGTMRHHLPHPELFIPRCHRLCDAHSRGALSGLQFADPESFAQAMPRRAREIQSCGKLFITPGLRRLRVLRIERGSKEVCAG